MTAPLTLERILPARAERVFEMISQPRQMARWWTHGGMSVPENGMNFERIGPWHAVIQMPDGLRRMVSGRVTHVSPPRHLAYSWAWHEGGPAGPRGAQTRVEMTVTPISADAASLSLRHHDLTGSDTREDHLSGWRALVDRLELGLAKA
jgi:uncharacterized protein YndB with AHSA1/START domain